MTITRSEAIPVLSLAPLAHERWRLGYATPAEETFGSNPFTELLLPARDEQAGPAPKLTFYAQPVDDTPPLELGRLAAWLDPNARRYEPARGLAFVPPESRGIVDGIVALEDRVDLHSRRFLAVRRTGSVEYGAYCTWRHPTQPLWLLSLELLVRQFAQFVRFLHDLAATFDRPRSWRIYANARQVSKSVLVGFGEGWAEPYRDFVEPSRCWEDCFQLEFDHAGDAETVDALVAAFADRIDLAYGSTKGRARNIRGERPGQITFGGGGY